LFDINVHANTNPEFRPYSKVHRFGDFSTLLLTFEKGSIVIFGDKDAKFDEVAAAFDAAFDVAEAVPSTSETTAGDQF
jgi:hypothetical protein